VDADYLMVKANRLTTGRIQPRWRVVTSTIGRLRKVLLPAQRVVQQKEFVELE